MGTQRRASDLRDWWLGLLGNVAGLLSDAHTLLGVGSTGRARSLGILAMEELGKAHRLYAIAAASWSTGAVEVELPAEFRDFERLHPPKLVQSMELADEAVGFWGLATASLSWLDEFIGLTDDEVDQHRYALREGREAAAASLNVAKQAGLYVDAPWKPHDAAPDGAIVREELESTAEAALVLLVQDHSRMKFERSPGVDYRSTNDLQLLFIALGGAPADDHRM